ncbi:MAG TPA: hypothetical protein VER98_12820 [Terriglobia bacterium]|nr:hypothetical protein [Terriglobia bacterium]
MSKTFLLGVFLLLGQQPERTGTIAGTVWAPPPQKISAPVQVILLSPQYTDLWSSDVQKRLDVYWERYKPAFVRQKEFFSEVSKQAHREATNYIVRRMRRDSSSNFSNYLKETSPDGNFEFRNVPYGEYKVLAIGKIGGEDVIWQESVDVRSPIPQFLQLKKIIP